jgi:hypothetical protein
VWIDDRERRRTLLLTVLLGDSGASFVEKAAGRTGKHWGRLVTEAIPSSTITKVAKVCRIVWTVAPAIPACSRYLLKRWGDGGLGHLAQRTARPASGR